MYMPLLSGPGYTVQPPPGFTLLNGDPITGTYWLLPPGSSPMDIPALLQIRPVNAYEIGMLLHNLYGFDNPYVATANAMNMGLVNVLGVMPVRQISMPQGATHIREFDAVTLRGFPVRVIVMVIQGHIAAVEVVIMLNLYRWAEFVAPSLNLVSAITLAGATAVPTQLQAVFDNAHTNQVEYRLVGADHQSVPITKLPVVYGNVTIINVDNSIKTGNINGTGIVVGEHSTATVTAGA